MSEKSKKVFSVIKKVVAVLLCLTVMAAATSFVVSLIKKKPLPMIFGYGACVVVSGSMEPTISVNDLIVVKEKTDLKVDDIVLYKDGESLVVHRIVNITNNGEIIVTKGDANKVNDTPFNRSEVVGEVMFHIPAIGRLVSFLQSPFGIITVLLLGYAVYLGVSIVKKSKTKE